MSHSTIFWQGGAKRGRWQAAQPVATAALAAAQTDALRAAGHPALAVATESVPRLLAVAKDVPPHWWDFENCRLRT